MTGRLAAAAGSAAAVTGPCDLPQPLLPALLRTQVSQSHCTLSLAGHHGTIQGNGSCKRLSHIIAFGHCLQNTSFQSTAAGVI